MCKFKKSGLIDYIYEHFNIYPEIIRSSFSSLKWRIETDESIDGIAKSTLLIAIFNETERHNVWFLVRCEVIHLE